MRLAAMKLGAARLAGRVRVSRAGLRVPLTVGCVVVGAVLVASGLWGWLGWEAAAVFAGGCLLAAGLSELTG